MSATNTTVVRMIPPSQTTTPAAQTPTRVRPPTMTPDKAVERYVELRDRVTALKKQQALELAPYTQAMEVLQGWLLEDLNAAGLKSMRASAGTAYKTIRTSATVESWGDTLEYIKANEAWELLEARVSKLAVEAIMQETKAPIPGVKTSREVIVNVRRGD